MNIKLYFCVSYIDVIINGSGVFIYIPGEGPVEINCTAEGEDSIIWIVNGTTFPIFNLINGALPNHGINGTNIVIDVPVNNTEYICAVFVMDLIITSDPVIIYIAGKCINVL